MCLVEALERAQAVFLGGGSDPAIASRRALAMLYGLVQQQATLLSFLSVFRLMGILFLLIIPLVFILRRPKGKRAVGA